MAGTRRPKKPVTSTVQPAAANSDSLGVPSSTQSGTETAGPPAKHKSVEAADRAGGHDVESNADVSQGGNVETGSSARRDSLESLPAGGSGDVERM
jgi:hypothetical protein